MLQLRPQLRIFLPEPLHRGVRQVRPGVCAATGTARQGKPGGNERCHSHKVAICLLFHLTALLWSAREPKYDLRNAKARYGCPQQALRSHGMIHDGACSGGAAAVLVLLIIPEVRHRAPAADVRATPARTRRSSEAR